MGKIKPLRNFEEDVKEGDLVRLIGDCLHREFEVAGYFRRLEKDVAYFKYFKNSPNDVHHIFWIELFSDLSAGACKENSHGHIFELGTIISYEILKRYEE